MSAESRHGSADCDTAKTLYAEVTPTGLEVEPTGVVEVSIEALRMLAAAGWELVERPERPTAPAGGDAS